MGFAIGTAEEKRQEKAVRGHYRKVAVGCWFTSTGRALPQMVKYEDDTGFRHMLNNIQVITSEQSYYAGVLARKYVCRSVIDERQQDFILLYHPVENTWDMIIQEI